MKAPDENSLLKEILADEKLSDLRRASLDRALGVMRQERQRRRTLRTSALVMLPLVVLLAMFVPFKTAQKNVQPDVSQIPPPTMMANAAPKASAIKTISDDELFALFPDQSVALIGKPGHQEFVCITGHQRGIDALISEPSNSSTGTPRDFFVTRHVTPQTAGIL